MEIATQKSVMTPDDLFTLLLLLSPGILLSLLVMVSFAKGG
jgi:hypothetical protein